MSLSTEIIRVLDQICWRLGIAIDWTADNVLPYVEDLCSRYVEYEIYTSTAWCVAFLFILILCAIMWLISFIVDRVNRRACASDFREFMVVLLLVILAISVFVWIYQAFDIIECYTLPEKTILDYISTLKD